MTESDRRKSSGSSYMVVDQKSRASVRAKASFICEASLRSEKMQKRRAFPRNLFSSAFQSERAERVYNFVYAVSLRPAGRLRNARFPGGKIKFTSAPNQAILAIRLRCRHGNFAQKCHYEAEVRGPSAGICERGDSPPRFLPGSSRGIGPISKKTIEGMLTMRGILADLLCM